MRELKIGTSWVRGVVGDAFNPELIVNFACAFGTWANGGAVTVGHDTRRSSPMVRAAVVSGLISAGCEVIDLGVCPSSLVSFAVRELGAAGGISITGGHNDVRWNALKFIGPDGALLNAVRSEEMLDIYHASAFLVSPSSDLRPIAQAPVMEDRYIGHMLACLDVEAIRSRRFRITVDLCNGACAALTERFLTALGCVQLPINDEPTGEFAHPPAPTPANMRQLATLVRCLNFDIGAALNVDGDRVGFVTAEGTPLSEEYVLPLAALGRLIRRPGPIVTNLSTSRMVDTVAAEYGQPVLRAAVGEGYVIDRGITEGAALAGEGSGGVAALPIAMTFDALLTLGIVLEALATRDVTLAALAGGLPRSVMRKTQIACPPDLLYHALEGFGKHYAGQKLDHTDGLRVDWEDSWLHVRASNTEPLLRIIVEATEEARADALFDEAMTLAHRMAFGQKGG